MDTSRSGQEDNKSTIHFEVGSVSIQRGEPMLSGAVGSFTISAPTSTLHPYTQSVVPVTSVPVRLNPTYSIQFPSEEYPGFTLSDFLSQLEEYTPTIPDTITNHYLNSSGFDSSDSRMSRLIALAAQKYLSDIINEAFTHCKLKGSAPVGKGNKKQEKKFVLTLDDLGPILNDYGLLLKKPAYYS